MTKLSPIVRKQLLQEQAALCSRLVEISSLLLEAELADEPGVVLNVVKSGKMRKVDGQKMALEHIKFLDQKRLRAVSQGNVSSKSK